MNGGLSAEEVEALIVGHAERAGTAIRLQPGPVWLMVRPRGSRIPEQGWKLHVSARIATLGTTADAIVPALLAEGCAFKIARSGEALARMNDGTTTPSSIGKAFTVYPEQDRVREVGLLLAELLRGRAAPRVLSDRRVAPDAPVYYRYGPIDKPWTADAQGKLVMTLTGPDGEEFPAQATLRYRQPGWVVDPFTGQGGDGPVGAVGPVGAMSGVVGGAGPVGGVGGGEKPAVFLASSTLSIPPTRLGDHFEIDGGIVHAGRGDVMRAVDLRDGGRVIVKQSRALVDEGEDGVDTRLRVRNERRVLAALEGVEGVAGFVDHFRADADEFLVTRDVGRFNLADDVMEHGRYAAADEPEAVPGRTLERLAQRMAAIILAVHERGVLIRDLNPRNVVVGPDGDANLIDLGLAGFNGLHLPGGTSGYSSARQFRSQEPTTGDDLLALGTTLIYAWTALPPVVLSKDSDEPRWVALRMIRARRGPAPDGVVGLICDLLSMDDERTHEAARLMAAGSSGWAADADGVARPAAVSDGLVAEIAGNLLGDLVGQTWRVLGEVPRYEKVAVDGCVYRGGAGIGLELLEHLGDGDGDGVGSGRGSGVGSGSGEGVGKLVEELVRFSERGADVVRLGPGLWTGRTGLDLFRVSALRRLAGGVEVAADAGVARVDAEAGAGAGAAAGVRAAAGVGASTGVGASAGVGAGAGVRAGVESRIDVEWKPEYCDLISGASGVGLGHLLLHDLDGRPEHLDVARCCAEHVLANTVPDERSQPGVLPELAGVEPSAAKGHGLAGTVEALVAIGARLGDARILAAADERARDLMERADRLAVKSRRPTTAPLAASWCQGLSGIASTLLFAGDCLGDARYVAAARRAADACIALVPRIDKPIQCCGLAGVGNMLIDVAVHDDDEKYWGAARGVIGQMLLRSAGAPGHPLFVKDNPTEYSASWAYGVAGILSFFRRFLRGGGAMVLGVGVGVGFGVGASVRVGAGAAVKS
ncbi:lanthionine synthetase LanC family protein [Catenulispora yoronensis]